MAGLPLCRGRGAGMSWRVVALTCLLFFTVPPMLAYGWTLRRYASETTYPNTMPLVEASTDAYLDREYNRAYRDPDMGFSWRVRYTDSNGNITWQAESATSPTSIGQTTGPRKAWCFELERNYLTSVAYNCDTTVP